MTLLHDSKKKTIATREVTKAGRDFNERASATVSKYTSLCVGNIFKSENEKGIAIMEDIERNDRGNSKETIAN